MITVSFLPLHTQISWVDGVILPLLTQTVLRLSSGLCSPLFLITPRFPFIPFTLTKGLISFKLARQAISSSVIFKATYKRVPLVTLFRPIRFLDFKFLSYCYGVRAVTWRWFTPNRVTYFLFVSHLLPTCCREESVLLFHDAGLSLMFALFACFQTCSREESVFTSYFGRRPSGGELNLFVSV